MDGSDSDPDPVDDLTYQWSHDSPLVIKLADHAALSTAFTAPNVGSDTHMRSPLSVYETV